MAEGTSDSELKSLIDWAEARTTNFVGAFITLRDKYASGDKKNYTEATAAGNVAGMGTRSLTNKEIGDTIERLVKLIVNFILNKKRETKWSNILSWTSTLDLGIENQFRRTIFDGFCLISIAFKDQILKQYTDNVQIVLQDDINFRIFQYLSENPSNSTLLTSRQIFMAFLKGKLSGKYFRSIKGGINTAEILDNVGLLVHKQGNSKELYIQKRCPGRETNLDKSQFRYVYSGFEFVEGIPDNYLLKTSDDTAVSLIFKDDWRLNLDLSPEQRLMKLYRKNNFPLKTKFWPDERKFASKCFLKRKVENRLVVEEINELLTSKQRSKVVIAGLGGIGKTTTAKWFANYFQNNYDYIIWLDYQKGSKEDSLKTLAKVLQQNTDNVSLSELATRIFKQFDGFSCLFIFDNAEIDSYDWIRDFLPESRHSFSCHYIITSIDGEWGSSVEGNKIPIYKLNVFSPEESLKFMKANYSCSDDEKLKTLWKYFSGFPMAIKLALATLLDEQVTLDDYIQKIAKSDHILTKQKDIGYDKTVNTVKAALEGSLESMAKTEVGRLNLPYNILKSCSYLGTDEIYTEFLLEIENTNQIDDSLDLLERYSLIAKGLKSGQGTITMHSLLQQVIRNKEKEKGKEEANLEKIFETNGYAHHKLVPLLVYCKEYEDLFRKYVHKVRDDCRKINPDIDIWVKDIVDNHQPKGQKTLVVLNNQSNVLHLTRCDCFCMLSFVIGIIGIVILHWVGE